jgi:hypothetical protein
MFHRHSSIANRIRQPLYTFLFWNKFCYFWASYDQKVGAVSLDVETNRELMTTTSATKSGRADATSPETMRSSGRAGRTTLETFLCNLGSQSEMEKQAASPRRLMSCRHKHTFASPLHWRARGRPPRIHNPKHTSSWSFRIERIDRDRQPRERWIGFYKF